MRFLAHLVLGVGAVALLTVACDDGPQARASSGRIARLGCGAAPVGGKVYVVGGFTFDGGQVGRLEAYDPTADVWTRKTPMPTPRMGLAVTTVGGAIYALGGRARSAVLTTVERYSPASDTWTPCAPMPTARWNLMTCAVGGKIYALGGIAGVGGKRRVLDVVEVYDPAKNAWSRLGPMPVPRSAAAAAVLGDQVFVIGGRLRAGRGKWATARVDVYDCSRKVWKELRPLARPRTGAAAGVLGGRILVVGGAAAGGPTATVEVYDPKTGTWTSAAPLREARTGLNCAVVGNTLYVIGGMNRPDKSGLVMRVERLME